MSEESVQILAVDDDPPNLIVLECMFRKSEMDIVGVASAAEGIELLKEREFGAVLSDVSMSPMSGFDMAREMKKIEKAKHTPIIFISGLLHDHDYTTKVYESGAVDSLLKPVDGEILRSKVSVFADLYLQRKKLRKAILQQLEMKDRFRSQVSHELKTPLNSFYQFLQIVESGMAGEVNEEQHDCLNMAISNAVSLREMIEDLMNVTRIANGKLSVRAEEMCLESLLDSCIRSLQQSAADKSFTMDVDISAQLPILWGDPKRVRQVIINLLTNAIKFGHEGGYLKVSAGKCSNHRNEILLSVEDDGPGIAPHLLPHVFDRLCQVDQRSDVRRQGLGLGLFICRELIEALGGKIWVESTLGQGSIFSVTLPEYNSTLHQS
ncbi:MAG: signal transduction histidine kinase [Verrucomicrobiales bacterium]|jgi:signal transduction histidine kinase